MNASLRSQLIKRRSIILSRVSLKLYGASRDSVSSTGSTMHQSVHLSRGKKGEFAYWQGEAFSNRLAPVPRILHPLGHTLSFIMERNKTSRDEVHNVRITILKRSVVHFIFLKN